MATRPPARSGQSPSRQRSRKCLSIKFAEGRRPWIRVALAVLAALASIMVLVGSFYWIKYGKLIDAKLGGEQRPIPRIFGRPYTLQPGSAISPTQFVQRLNDVGYAERPKVEGPGEFNVQGNSVTVGIRPAGQAKPQTVKVDFSKSAAPVVTKLTVVGGGTTDSVALEAPLLAALAPGEKRRYVPLANVPKIMVERGRRDRGPALLRAPGRRSDSRRRRAHHQPARRQAVSGRRQHAHAADRQEHVPHAGEDADVARCRSSSWRSCWSRGSRRTRSSSST